MFNREPMQCLQNRATMVILARSSKNSGAFLDQLYCSLFFMRAGQPPIIVLQ